MPVDEVVQELRSQESDLSKMVEVTFASLPQDEKEQLSKVLFPETHTNVVTVLGKDREMFPTPIRVSRKLRAVLDPLQEKIQNADTSPGSVDLDEEVLKVLFDVAKVLAAHYGWADVTEAADKEDLTQQDLEALAYTQQALNEANDFLLQPLRVVVRMLQARELAMKHAESTKRMSISVPV